LARGDTKPTPLARALDGPVTPDVPASVLRTHPRCLVIADRAARP
jgi:glucosamine-6-phosphate deaminase